LSIEFKATIETWPIGRVIPYPENAKAHPVEQVKKIAASLSEFGNDQPLVVDGAGVLIKGHGRLMAYKMLKATEVPVIVRTDLSPAQVRQARLMDNRSAQSDWDLDALALELHAMAEQGIDLSLTGFDPDELASLIGGAGEQGGLTPDDQVPEPGKEPITRPGDVWNLGPHRVMCGDATVLSAADTLMDGTKAELVWTDPPYNVAYEGKAGKIKNDDMKNGAFREFLDLAFGTFYAWMKDGAAIYVAHADTEGLNFRGAFEGAGFKLSGCVIWKKDSLVLGRSDYQWQHEPILYGWKPGAAHRWFGGRKNTTIQDLSDGTGAPFVKMADGRWQLTVGNQIIVVDATAVVDEVVPTVLLEPKPKRNDTHPTMKPVALIERMMKYSSKPGDVVLDLFGGSGSTLIAAHKHSRAARLMELDAIFVDVIVRRWQEFTGQEATLDGTGQTFAALAAERATA
jgi:DNA modification methylase